MRKSVLDGFVLLVQSMQDKELIPKSTFDHPATFLVG